METLWEAMLGSEIRMREVRGVKTRFLEAGEGDPLILLHGTGGHIEAWAQNVAALAQKFRVIAIDMVGHGLTDKPDLDYVLTDYTRHVRDVMDELGIEKAYFAGLSLGAWVASWLALENPERVAGIINCTGGVFRWPEGQDEAEAKERQGMVKTSSDLSIVSETTVRNRLHMLFHDPSVCPEELVRVRLGLYTLPGVPELLPKLHNMLAYDSPARAEFSLTEERLKAIECPVLYLWGEFNPGGSVRSATRAAELTPQGELTVLDGAGHWPQWEKPDAFQELVIEFLTRPAHRITQS